MGRVIWKSEIVDKCFIEACLHEVATNGREGGSLKAKSWKVVEEKLKNEHNFIVDRKQMKSRYDYLKGKYVVWAKLKNKTGNVYDPVSNTFNLTEEEWIAEMKVLCLSIINGATFIILIWLVYYIFNCFEAVEQAC